MSKFLGMKFTRRQSGEDKTTVAVKMHFTKQEIESIVAAYQSLFGSENSTVKRDLRNALHWFATGGIHEALANHYAAEHDDEDVA